MLIYNFQKEFLGIDEKDLVSLGYKNLSELKTEVSDFADLFVKTPGYIHNFKHVHWIDFITCAESYEESKVIINVNNKNYKSTITITTAFLIDSPSQKAYLVSLNNLRELTHQENEAVANDIIERPNTNFEQKTKPIFNTPEYNENFNEPQEIENQDITIDPYETPIDINLEDSSNTDEIKIDIDIDMSEEKLDVEDSFQDDFDNDIIEENVAPVEVIQEIRTIQENFTNGYIYNPSVASDELGLPLDLIEEFIQDFIAQAKEFKEKLYLALDEADASNMKILSHKLKGVAANLRIEDAFETLSTINTSSDFNVIEENLDTFYNIIAKLAGEEISVTKEHIAEIEEELSLNFKDDEDDLYSDPIEITDADVPTKLDLPELADDTFLAVEETPTFKDELPTLEIDEPSQSMDLDTQEQVEEEVKEVLRTDTISYSKETIANEIGIDIDSFHALFEDYLQDSKTLLKSMKTSINTQDFKSSQAEALRLRGMSDNMRVNSFSNELEEIIHSSNKQTIIQAINKIEATLAQLSNLGV